MTLIRLALLSFLTALLLSTGIQADAYSEDGWYLSTFLGGSISAPSGVRIDRVNEPDVHTTGKWRGHPVEDSLYYAVRMEKWTGDKGRGVEWIHHKIFYAGDHPEVVDLSISDGFNLLYYNWAYRSFSDTIARFGAGLVFSHIDITLPGRDRFYNQGGIGGSYLSGVSVQYGIEKWIYETKRNFVNFETKFTASYTRPPISENSNEYLETMNYAIHFLLGVGSKPLKAKTRKEFWYTYAPTLGYGLIPHITPTGKVSRVHQ